MPKCKISETSTNLAVLVVSSHDRMSFSCIMRKLMRTRGTFCFSRNLRSIFLHISVHCGIVPWLLCVANSWAKMASTWNNWYELSVASSFSISRSGDIVCIPFRPGPKWVHVPLAGAHIYLVLVAAHTPSTFTGTVDLVWCRCLGRETAGWRCKMVVCQAVQTTQEPSAGARARFAGVEFPADWRIYRGVHAFLAWLSAAYKYPKWNPLQGTFAPCVEVHSTVIPVCKDISKVKLASLI